MLSSQCSAAACCVCDFLWCDSPFTLHLLPAEHLFILQHQTEMWLKTSLKQSEMWWSRLQVQLLCAPKAGSACPTQARREGGDFMSCDRVDWKETARWIPGKKKKCCLVWLLLSFPPLSWSHVFFLLQKVFVLPNMDDIYLPLMNSGADSPQASQRLSSQSQRSQSSSTESIERIPPEISGAESD